MHALKLVRVLVGIAVSISATAATEAAEIDARFKKKLIDRIDRQLTRRAYAHGVDFGRWRDHVASHRSAIDAADTEQTLTRALNAALAEFGVSHLWVWSPADMAVREAGRQGGLGLKTVTIDEGQLVTMVIAEGPAAAAGLRRGDRITRVDGAPADASALGRGTRGERRVLTVERDGEDSRERVLTLGEYPRANPATLHWLEGDEYAVITIPSFSRSFYRNRPLYLRDVVESFFEEASRAKGIVIDVRSNGGGYYLFPEHLSAMIMERDTDAYLILHAEEREAFLKRGGDPDASLLEMARHSGQVIRPMPLDDHTPYAGPVAVLVDARSGSAGETFPAGVQAARRGVIVGTRTAGRVLAGDNHRLPGGFELFYPQAESVLPDGTRLEGNGVRPDIELTARQTADDAYIFDVAVQALRRARDHEAP